MKLLLIYRTGKTEEITGVTDPPVFFRHETKEHPRREFTFVRANIYTDRGHLIYIENS